MITSETINAATRRKRSIYSNKLNEQAVRDLINRVVFEGFDANFVFSKTEDNGSDKFSITAIDGKIRISASNTNAACAAVNYYLKNFLNCNISLISRNVNITPQTKLPLPQKEIKEESPFLYRYFLNYCTYSYTMAFWKWEDFEYLIDYMALSGINLALNIVGYEAAVKELLEKYGYTAEEVGEYICGSAYFAWQWMNNLMGFCGPLPEWWYEERKALTRKINKRFNDLGIEVMLPGFFGSVPQSFKNRYKADIISQGKWCIAYDRPDLILPTDPLFSRMAEDYYNILEDVMGIKASYFSIDPFHEGGNEEGIDKQLLTKRIYEAMSAYNPNAVWVFQGWILNPRRDMISVLEKQNVLITDLVSDITPCFKDDGDDFLNYPYVLCQVNNYGGQRNYRGNFVRSMNTAYEALESGRAEGMCGIGLLPEGIEDVEMFYDLLNDMSYRKEKPDLDKWLESYARYRYNTENNNVKDALKLLAEKVLICTLKEGTRESVFIARPSVNVQKVSMWTATFCAYDEKDLAAALRLMFSQYDALRDNDCYQFDITDLARQALSNYGWHVFERILNGENTAENQQLFLKMIIMQDSLMSANPRTCFSTWLNKARSFGKNEQEKDSFEKNARYLISFWSDEI
ncbi:MAG: alpha-N-acetylglucosaminidase TIM-barrel domain-containing protein, partial [Acutalibacteraceae bacterium]